VCLISILKTFNMRRNSNSKHEGYEVSICLCMHAQGRLTNLCRVWKKVTKYIYAIEQAQETVSQVVCVAYVSRRQKQFLDSDLVKHRM
jgi:hypothetical protein